jgi:hypothetical protein
MSGRLTHVKGGPILDIILGQSAIVDQQLGALEKVIIFREKSHLSLNVSFELANRVRKLNLKRSGPGNSNFHHIMGAKISNTRTEAEIWRFSVCRGPETWYLRFRRRPGPRCRTQNRLETLYFGRVMTRCHARCRGMRLPRRMESFRRMDNMCHARLKARKTWGFSGADIR